MSATSRRRAASEREADAGERLVAADVERAHDARLAAQPVEQAGIDAVLLLLVRQPVAAEKQELGAQEADPEATLHVARRLIALRHAHPALRYGGLDLIQAADVLVFERFERADSGERLLCVFNLGHQPVDWTPPAGARRIEAVNWSEADGSSLKPLAGLLFAV